jgi:hypothetical protein
MKKIIIPRKDHEVYFIAVAEKLKNKQIRPFVIAQIDKLHPRFSENSILDLQMIAFDGSHWVMVTVMETEILEEYRILNKNAVSYTNTSIVIHGNEFLKGGIKVIDDEHIGFDTEKNEPVSVPLEIAKKDESPVLKAELKGIPQKYGVFAKKMPRYYAPVMTTISILLISLSSIFILAAKSANEIVTINTNNEAVIETKYLPSAIEILAKISCDVVNAGGNMTRWRFNEEVEPLMEIQMRGIDVLTLHKICNQYEFACLQDIQDVKYNEKEPNVTISLNTAGGSYTILKAGAFSPQNATLPMIADLSGFLRQQNIQILSETLPTSNNGNIFYTITYTAKDWNLIRSMEIIHETCDKYLLRIKKMDVSIGSNNNNFTVICSLSHCNNLNNDYKKLEDEIKIIPQAFGYREEIPKIAHQFEVIPEEEIKPAIVGSIRDGNGKLIFYRDITGKIINRRDNE